MRFASPAPRTVLLLATLIVMLPPAVAWPIAAIAQSGTAVAAGTAVGTPVLAGTPVTDPDAIVAALTAARPPATLPGNGDAPVDLLTWEEMYGGELDGSPGAWVLDGDLELPLATVIVFDGDEGARLGLGEFENDDARVSARGADAWLVADRAKWICITVTGPMLVAGQGLPVTSAEPEADVQERACAVLEETLDWLEQDVLLAPLATPGPRPTPTSDGG